MPDASSELIEELSNTEKKVLLTLHKLSKTATPEQLLQKGGFKQLVEVMNAASWLQSRAQ
jgi:phenylalanyl-tRNA synthetase alpha chain